MTDAGALAQGTAGANPLDRPVETPREVCPLCGGGVRPEQDWCLRCGAAARTRLAAPPKWKPLAFALLALIVLSLAVLIAALAKLAG